MKKKIYAIFAALALVGTFGFAANRVLTEALAYGDTDYDTGDLAVIWDEPLEIEWSEATGLTLTMKLPTEFEVWDWDITKPVGTTPATENFYSLTIRRYTGTFDSQGTVVTTITEGLEPGKQITVVDADAVVGNTYIYKALLKPFPNDEKLIEEKVNVGTPLTIVPDGVADLKVEMEEGDGGTLPWVTFTLPKTGTLDGQPYDLPFLSSVYVYRTDPEGNKVSVTPLITSNIPVGVERTYSDDNYFDSSVQYVYTVEVRYARQCTTTSIAFCAEENPGEAVAPATPANVQGDYADGSISLTWDAVTTDVDGAAIEGVTYSVCDQEGATVAEGLEEPACSVAVEGLSDPGLYTRKYTVYAVLDGTMSEGAETSVKFYYTSGIAPQDLPGAFVNMDGVNISLSWKESTGVTGKVTLPSTCYIMDYNLPKPWIAATLEMTDIYEVTVTAQDPTMDTYTVGTFSNQQPGSVMTFTDPKATLVDKKYRYFILVKINPTAEGESAEQSITPGYPTDITPNPATDLEMTMSNCLRISCTLPTEGTLDGEVWTLPFISRLQILRQDTGADAKVIREFATVSNLTPGSNVEYTLEDQAFPDGEVATFIIRVFYMDQYADASTTWPETVEPVDHIPAAPANFAASYDDKKITLTWDAVTTATDGASIEGVTYTLLGSNLQPIAAGLTETSYVIDCGDLEAGEYTYAYGLVAVYEENYSDIADTSVSFKVGESSVEQVWGEGLSVEGNRLRYANAARASVIVCTLDGRVVLSTDAADIDVVLPDGLYVVVADGKAAKVLVK